MFSEARCAAKFFSVEGHLSLTSAVRRIRAFERTCNVVDESSTFGTGTPRASEVSISISSISCGAGGVLPQGRSRRPRGVVELSNVAAFSAGPSPHEDCVAEEIFIDDVRGGVLEAERV